MYKGNSSGSRGGSSHGGAARSGGFNRSNSGGSRPSAPRSGGSSFGARTSGGSHSGGARSGGSSYGSRPSSGSGFRGARPGRSGGGSRGGFRGAPRKRFGGGQRIDSNRFINKAIVSTEPVKEYVSKHTFADFPVEERLKQNVITKGYKTPTPIQDQAIPEVLKGIDVVGLANTGTGKTAAFLIPLIDKVLKNPKEEVLVVIPTRELAIQIEDELRAFTKGLGIYSVVCVGGANIVPQLKALRYQNNFVIGTPGRLKDLIERKALKLTNFKTVVLDEADRMLDMGFVNDIKYMMSLMSSERQTLFFSATVSPEIQGLISKFLKNPVTISVKTGDTSMSVDQDVVRMKEGKNKIDMLHDLLITPGFDKVLVFGKTKHGVERLTQDLIKRGIKAESIHGNKTHGKRQKALSLFKSHHVQVLVATDVAARGLDIAGVTHVINYDLPATYDDCVHRIGRTGRGGNTGKALTFVD